MVGNSSFQVYFKQADFDGLIASMQALPKDIELASSRAANRTMQWLRAQVSRELSARFGIPKAKLRTRITSKRIGNSPLWVLFMGVNHMPIDVASPIKQSSIGLVHKGGTVRGGFKKSIFGGGEKGWIRKRRARALGLKLPGLDSSSPSAQSGLKLSHSRFPVLRISHDLEKGSRELFEKYTTQAHRQFMERFEHELSNVMRAKK